MGAPVSRYFRKRLLAYGVGFVVCALFSVVLQASVGTFRGHANMRNVLALLATYPLILLTLYFAGAWLITWARWYRAGRPRDPF